MSIELVARVLNTPTGLHPTGKLVLIGMANHASPDGSRVFPSVAQIAVYADCSERSVQYHLRRLEAGGWIELVATAHHHRPAEYRIRGENLAPLPVRGATGGRSGVQPEVGRGATAVAPRTVRNRQGTVTGVASLRKRDPIFETLAEIEGSDLADLTKSQRGALNKAAKELRDLGVDVEEIPRRATAFARRYPGATLTALALVRHWGELNHAGPDTRPHEVIWKEALGEHSS